MMRWASLHSQLGAIETLSVTHPKEYRLNRRGERILAYLRRRTRRASSGSA